MFRSFTASDAALVGLGFLFACTWASAGTITKTYTFNSGDTISSSQMNADFDQLFAEMNAKETRISGLETNSLHWDGSSTGLVAGTGRTSLGLGTAATLNAGTSATNVVQLDSSGKLPAGIGNFSWASAATSLTVTSATWQTVPSTAVSFSLSGTATIEVHAVGTLTMSGTAPAICAIRLILDGVGTGDASMGDLAISPLAASYAPYSDLQVISNVSSGVHSISVQLSMPGGSATSCSQLSTPGFRMTVAAH